MVQRILWSIIKPDKKNTQLTFKISTIITQSFIIGLTIKLISVFITQNKLSLQETGFSIEYIVTYVADIFLFFSGIMALRYENKYFKKRTRKRYLILLLLIVVVYLKSQANLFDASTFSSVKGIGPWLGLSVLFTAGNFRRVEVFKTFLVYCGIALVLGGLFFLTKLGISFDRKLAISNILQISLNLMWTTFILICFKSEYKKILTILFVFSFLFALFTASRSVILMHLLMILFLVFKIAKSWVYKTVFVIGILGLGTFSYSTFLNNKALQRATAILIDRLEADTRSNQITQFLENTQISDFIFGAGVFSQWEWDHRMYAYLDNQILLTAWWAGILPTIIYLSFLFSPIKKYLFRAKYVEKQAPSFIIFLWLLALLGLSIFTAIGSYYYMYIICFVLGYLLSNNDLKSNHVNQ